VITTTIEPPLTQWRPRARAPGRRPVIATGHQAWLWHPGILAKDIAMAVAAERVNGEMLHVVVDQDENPALRLELPIQARDQIYIEVHDLGPDGAFRPMASRPPVNADEVVQRLRFAQSRHGQTLIADLDPLIEAWSNLPAVDSLAQQIGEVTARMMRPWVGEVPVIYATDLATESRFVELRTRLLHDARRSVACYNRSVARHPQARVAPLADERERVELPLWAIEPRGPRLPVFADLADTEPLLVLADGSPVAATHRLAPRALLMTAYLRSAVCDLFIHGKGGWLYDRITEEWWREWTGEELAPMAVVSADVRMDFDVPVADRAEVDRAVWWAHHVPHNVDRATPADGPLVTRKRGILAHMDDDRDKRRRAAAFAELHKINARLVGEHPDVVAHAGLDLERARTGLLNRQVTMKRDWFFGLYPPKKIEELRQSIAGSARTATSRTA
jgi:hypothetical protein